VLRRRKKYKLSLGVKGKVLAIFVVLGTTKIAKTSLFFPLAERSQKNNTPNNT
jgi:hypothetical protein